MYRTIASMFSLLLLFSPSNAADEVYHKHGERGHSHVLPAQGLIHQHNRAKPAQSLLKTNKISSNGVTHFHGTKQHSHPLPKNEQLAHKHGISEIGSFAKKDTTTVRATTATTATTATKYICSDLTPTSAMALYLKGHTYLDRDNDGQPCEPSDFPSYTRPTSSNCHMVGGYYRKSGTYVRGHMRCR